MSKYKKGDKVVLTVSDVNDKVYYPHYEFNNNFNLWKQSIDELVEPLSTYTEPLEDKIKKLMEENIRLLAENEKLKKDLEYYHTGTDICDMESARIAGQNEAWELARKIILPPSKGGMSSDDYIAIFGSCISEAYVMKNYTYTEAAAKVAEWENEKDEIKVGDIIKIHEVNDDDLCVLYMSTDKKYYNAVDGYGAVYNMLTKGMIAKTGRHIDIDGFLKQIRGEQE